MNCFVPKCPRTPCMKTEYLDDAEGNRLSGKTKVELLCLIHFYGSRFSGPDYDDFTNVFNVPAYREQIKAASKIVKRALNAIEDDIHTFASEFRSKRARLRHHSSQSSNINRTVSEPFRSAATSSLTKTSKTKISSNSNNRNSGAHVKAREQIWKTSKSDEHSKALKRKQVTHSKLNITGSEFEGLDLNGIVAPSTKIRKNSAVMLLNALSVNSESTQISSKRNIAITSLAIEKEVFKKYPFVESSTSGDETFNAKNASNRKAYTTRLRKLYINIKDIRNQELRGKILKGELPVERVAGENDTELMNPESRKDRNDNQQRLMKQRTRQSLGKTNEGVKTNDFKCPLCANTLDNTLLLVSSNRHVGKCETWGNKNSMDTNTSRVICSKCDHEFFR
mmetsp:Transcript_7913/g.9045  ORF Transcript_7913/g.9045 Transcript_7913/m.9045 type:complete len:394 (-) Transcript_7913:97-1278(-)